MPIAFGGFCPDYRVGAQKNFINSMGPFFGTPCTILTIINNQSVQMIKTTFLTNIPIVDSVCRSQMYIFDKVWVFLTLKYRFE